MLSSPCISLRFTLGFFSTTLALGLDPPFVFLFQTSYLLGMMSCLGSSFTNYYSRVRSCDVIFIGNLPHR